MGYLMPTPFLLKTITGAIYVFTNPSARKACVKAGAVEYFNCFIVEE